ncbi:MAG: hypothetical protein DMF82_17140 [Acidobacteria bacterium]|nr:MAG: hypothetical protein DMF82_17140 [Acidobacteriota bacterium]
MARIRSILAKFLRRSNRRLAALTLGSQIASSKSKTVGTRRARIASMLLSPIGTASRWITTTSNSRAWSSAQRKRRAVPRSTLRALAHRWPGW